MKKIFFKSLLALTVGSVSLSSCIGSFSLFNKLLSWNRGINNKFASELVFLVCTPAYAFCGAADWLVLNTVEFWSGSNPIAKAGDVENVWGKDGKLYAVKTLPNGYEVTRPTGEKVLFVHNADDDSWWMEQDGVRSELFRFNNDGTAEALLPNGERMNVSLNEDGMYRLRMAVNDGMFFAAR